MAAARRLLLAALVAAPVAEARSRIHVGSMTIDGQAVREMTCELEPGNLGAVMKVVGALAKQKKALDACAPGGAAYRIRWTWVGGKPTAVAVVAASDASGGACVAGVAKLTRNDSAGDCEAIVLVGESEAATRAADALGATKK
jgi:hypothetical protein